MAILAITPDAVMLAAVNRKQRVVVGQECRVPVIHFMTGFTLCGKSAIHMVWILRRQIRLLMTVDALNPVKQKTPGHGITVTTLAVDKIVCTHDGKACVGVDFFNLEDFPTALIVTPLAITAEFGLMYILMTGDTGRFDLSEVLYIVTGLAPDEGMSFFQWEGSLIMVKVDLGPGVCAVTGPTIHGHVFVWAILSLNDGNAQEQSE